MSRSSWGAPFGYLDSAGPRAREIVPLTWFTLVVSVVVCIVIGILLWLAVRRRRSGDYSAASARALPLDMRAIPPERGAEGVRWIGIGLLISAFPLAVTLIWTMLTLAAVAGPPAHPGLVLDVTGRQFWWEVHYNGDKPSDGFTTANEIHIPVGVPIQANQSGRYLGECSEFCGFQHAHMQFEVIAESPTEFAAWRAAQLQPAPVPKTAEQQRGLKFVEYRCGLCHAVRGTLAGAVNAPDLTHLASRRTLAAGTLPNDHAGLADWIQGSQALKRGSKMPDQRLDGQQLSDTLAYLETLK
jgi:cytochrome c oxidase subunit 2